MRKVQFSYVDYHKSTEFWKKINGVVFHIKEIISLNLLKGKVIKVPLEETYNIFQSFEPGI
jgi:hypothetical protein